MTDCHGGSDWPTVSEDRGDEPTTQLLFREEFEMSDKVGRPVARPATETEPTGETVSRPGFEGNFPLLWQFLQKQRDLGEYHKTGSITIFVDGEKIKLCVNDRPTRQSCFVSGGTLLEALSIVEQGLVEGSLRWSSVGYKRRSAPKVNKRTPLLDA